MTLSRDEKNRIQAWMLALPGKRGIDIPPHIYDTIYHVANGITLPIWGRPILPRQIQALYAAGLHSPAQIHEAFNNMDHPHAPNVKIGEYQHYAKAHQTYEEHR